MFLLKISQGVFLHGSMFLASMHAARGRHLPPTPTALGAGLALPVHHATYLAALVLVAAAIVLDDGVAMRIGAVAGLASSIAFLVFFATVVVRMLRANARAAAPVAPA